MVVIDPKRMEGGDIDGIALKIRDVTRYDTGNYTCELENEFGQGVSSNGITVDVHCMYYIVDHSVLLAFVRMKIISSCLFSFDIQT